MAQVLNLKSLDKRFGFDTRIDTYIDGDGFESRMRWIPPFRSLRALTALAAAATPSNTIGDFFHPADIPSGAVVTTDYAVHNMGGFWGDVYLCSSPDASSSSQGTVANGSTVKAYVSQPGVALRVDQNIGHFKTYLAARFSTGGFAGQRTANGWAGKGGLMTDAHWFEMWIWTRINRQMLRGNTGGYNNSIPRYHADTNEIGILDGSQPAIYGTNLTGGGPASWEIPLSDFCGNRWEFTDGLRLYNGAIHTAGKTINPPGSYADAAYTATGLSIGAISSGLSTAKYRVESSIALHGITETTTTAGTGPFDGSGFWFDASGERIALRGGNCNGGAQCPGALSLSDDASNVGWGIGGRAVLVP